MYQLRYLSRLLPCTFYHSDDVTCSNETLGLKICKNILCFGYVQSYLLNNHISDHAVTPHAVLLWR